MTPSDAVRVEDSGLLDSPKRLLSPRPRVRQTPNPSPIGLFGIRPGGADFCIPHPDTQRSRNSASVLRKQLKVTGPSRRFGAIRRPELLEDTE